MKQGVLPLQYEEEKNLTGMTALAGLPVYVDLMHMAGIWPSTSPATGSWSAEKRLI